MYCLFFVFASLFLCEVSAEAQPIERIIQDYFNSNSVQKFRKEWQKHRKPIQHAIATALKDTVGLPGMNVYVNRIKDKLAAGFFHNDNQVRVIFSELNLEQLPRCWLPEVQLSLASNALKIQTGLSKLTIHANYALVRNRTDTIYKPEHQNPLESSPFLFEEVLDVGRVAITIQDCSLSGFIMTILTGDSVNLGYDHFKFFNCFFFIEIYRPGESSPPVFAPYNLSRQDGLSLTDLLMKPLLTEELVPKLQATMFSLVNTSALFGNELQEYRENQEIVFQTTAQYLTELIRNLNRITIKKNHGTIEMEDYTMHWDDGRTKPSNKNQNRGGEALKLTDMVLTGLDTIYSAHSGGPFKINTVMIAEEIRFSSLQVRGKLELQSSWSDEFPFATEISDVVVDLQLGKSQRDKENTDDGPKPTKNHGFEVEVKGFRRMVFTVPTLVHESAESLIGGYLLKVVPKLIKSHLTAIFPEALHPAKAQLQPSRPAEVDSKRERDVFKKNKKRFKSANRSSHRHRYRSGKRVADNEIRKNNK